MARLLIVISLTLLCLSGCSFGSFAQNAPTAAPAISPAPSATPTARPTKTPTPSATQAPLARLVSVGQYKLYIECKGTGGPAVVMDSGLSATSALWAQVTPQVAKFTRVCVYDRANVGRSERAPTPRTSQQIVDDLHMLLQNAGVGGPYVLVGHSLGGLNVRLYAHDHPQEVAGLVLVDAAHEDEWERFASLLPPEYPGEPAQLKDFRKELRDPIKGIERIDIKQSGDQLKAKRGPLGSLPLVVISHGKPASEVPAFVSFIVEGVWSEMQRDLLKWSSNSRQLIAEQSGHNIPLDQPQLVSDAIQQVVNAARAN